MYKRQGKKFWSTKDPGQSPFSYQAGVGQVSARRADASSHRRMLPRAHAPFVARAFRMCFMTCMLTRPSHRHRAPRATCRARRTQVITGWDQGCLGMTVGEERQLVIPAKEGYGAAGFPAWGIPAGGTLMFTLECLAIEGKDR